VRPYLKNNEDPPQYHHQQQQKKKKKKRKKKKKEIPEGLRPGSSGRALVWQAQGPEFNL
jgi:hypothetical protein